MKRAWTIILGVALMAGCTPSSSEGNNGSERPMPTNDTSAIVWDFRTPLTTIDLGSQFDEVLKLEGRTDVTVVFPSGRTLSGIWERGAFALAQGGANLGNEPPQPVDQIELLEDEADDVAAVRASAERFIAEFGTGIRGRDGMSIEEWLDEFEATVAADGGKIVANSHGDGPDSNGSTIRGFEAAEQDGITPGWLTRVVDGGVTLRTVIGFEPAPDP